MPTCPLCKKGGAMVFENENRIYCWDGGYFFPIRSKLEEYDA